MASYRKRGKTWRAEIVRKGYAPVSATFGTRAAAVAWATAREAEMLAGRRGDIIPRTVRQAIARYRDTVSPTHRGARWEAVRLDKFIGNPDKGKPASVPFAGRWLSDVRRDDVAAWRDLLLETLATSSARREFGMLRAVFAVAVNEWRWLHESPFRGVRPPAEGKPRSRRVSDDELDRILLALNYERGTRPATASQFIAAAALLAVETAMRQGEILSLTRDQVHATARFLHLEKTKNGDERDIPLSRTALALLDLLPVAGPLFLVAPRTFDTLFRRARANAGIVDLHFHDLRREATTRLAAKLDVLTLAKMTGHRDPKVLLRVYYAPSMASVAEMLD